MSWEVYTCAFADKDTKGKRACGLNGQTFDCSRDECHHPLDIEDARLMAAAPELLEACKEALFTLTDTTAYDSDRGVTLRMLRAAIAKAEGIQK